VDDSFKDLHLPSDYRTNFRSLNTPEKAMLFSSRNLIRFMYFDDDEEAVFGPLEVINPDPLLSLVLIGNSL